jgi:uncharacterized Zn-binding protein involved in type VI secretion
MGAFVRIGDNSTGHGCFPPTELVYTPVTRTFCDGKLIAVVGARYAAHSCNNTTHQENPDRTIIGTGSANTFIEGYPLARIGDPIACGDRVAQGSESSFGA